jgi:hypothetical protein
MDCCGLLGSGGSGPTCLHNRVRAFITTPQGTELKATFVCETGGKSVESLAAYSKVMRRNWTQRRGATKGRSNGGTLGRPALAWAIQRELQEQGARQAGLVGQERKHRHRGRIHTAALPKDLQSYPIPWGPV